MRILAAFLFVASVAVACGPSVTQACQDYATAWCNRHYTCESGSQLDALKNTFGATATDCVTVKSNAFYLNCAAAQSTCPPGTSYDTGAAEQCVTDYGNVATLSCDDVIAEKAPESCSQSKLCH